ncbi:MAG TPA: hypothetical protein PKL34_07575, partial [Candidatus Cloacimonadota bacterium]|nr:hypothetical protein [Candidatus Cloacimonadota bacterium]
NKLLQVLKKLVAMGNTVVVIEHNLDVIKSADWVIDLGPEGGDEGGRILIEGTPEDLIACPESATGYFLKQHYQRETSFCDEIQPQVLKAKRGRKPKTNVS